MDRIEASNAAYGLHCEACELRGAGQNEEAAGRWATCVELAPDEPVYLREYADCLARLQRWELDLHYASLAASLEPSNPEAWALMGSACGYLGRQEEAKRCYDRANRLAPNSPSVLWNRSLYYLLHGRYAEGWRDYEWRFLTNQRRRTLKAAWDGRADGPSPPAPSPIGMGEGLVEGVDTKGIGEPHPPFERKRGPEPSTEAVPGNAAGRGTSCPSRAMGVPPGRRSRVLLVWSEQGLGDTLQFVRFLKLAKERWGGRVVFETQRELVALFHGQDLGADEIMAPNVGGSVPFDDFEHVALMSLPMVLGLDREDDFWRGPYLGAGTGTSPIPQPLPIPMGRGWGIDVAVSMTLDGRDAGVEDHPGQETSPRPSPWKGEGVNAGCSALAHFTQPVLDGMPIQGSGHGTRQKDMPAQGCRHGTRIGVCWQGARSNGCDAQRSIGRDEFWNAIVEPWLGGERGDVTFYSVNPDARLPDCEGCVNPELSSFVETARVIAGLDLVITVDTSVAHLAGAMGKPVWILLRYATDWRWCLNHESTSPWYPSARLFRQKAYGIGWGEVLGRVRSALEEFGTYPGSLGLATPP